MFALVPQIGYVKLHAEVPTTRDVPKRCTLKPQSRYVPSRGYGYAIAPRLSEAWRRRDLQGQLRLGLPGTLLSSIDRGQLRFPSGYVTLFDCRGQAGPVSVEEPEWIQLRLGAEPHLEVELLDPWLRGEPELELALRSGETVRSLIAERSGVRTWTAAITAADEALMIRYDGRWIGRWFDL